MISLPGIQILVSSPPLEGRWDLGILASQKQNTPKEKEKKCQKWWDITSKISLHSTVSSIWLSLLLSWETSCHIVRCSLGKTPVSLANSPQGMRLQQAHEWAQKQIFPHLSLEMTAVSADTLISLFFYTLYLTWPVIYSLFYQVFLWFSFDLSTALTLLTIQLSVNMTSLPFTDHLSWGLPLTLFSDKLASIWF